MQTILTFGDSNTHGTQPIRVRGQGGRFGADTRWPCVMAERLGCRLIEEGLPGRTACPGPDPEMGAHMDGHLGLRIALASHGPIDRLTIMLGTNDSKAHFGRRPEDIAAGLAGLLAIANDPLVQDRHGGFRVLVIAPPPVVETGELRRVFLGGAERAAGLAPPYEALARAWDADFLDAGAHISVSDVDGVHFDADAHRTLGDAVGEALA